MRTLMLVDCLGWAARALVAQHHSRTADSGTRSPSLRCGHRTILLTSFTPGRSAFGLDARPERPLATVRRVARTIAVGGYDLVLGHLFYAAFYTAARVRWSAPVRVAVFHNLGYDTYPRRRRVAACGRR